MNETITIEVPETIARDIERLARQRGESAADFIVRAAAEKAGAASEAARYFAERAARASPGAALRFLREEGGDEPPQRGDEVA